MIFQHRDTPADDLKRQQLWTTKLRRVAELEVTMTDPDQFSSSRHTAFSNAMKARAENEILPSLFDAMQSYEDFVNQYRLWTYTDLSKAPIGKSITWRSIPRPPTQIHRYKRPRPTRQRPKAGVARLDDDEDSGHETEVDNTMTKAQLMLDAATEALREAKAARRVARAATSRAVSVHPTAAVNDIAATPTLTTKQLPQPTTPQSQSLGMEDAKPATGISVDDSMTPDAVHDQAIPLQTTGYQTSSGRSIPDGADVRTQFQIPQARFHQASRAEEQDVKGGTMNPGFQTQINHPAGPYLNTVQQYQTIFPSGRNEDVAMEGLNHSHNEGDRVHRQDNYTYGAPASAESFNSLGSTSFNSLESSSFTDFPSYTFHDDVNGVTVFSEQYPIRGNQSFLSPSMTAHNMSYACDPSIIYTSMDCPMSNLPPRANQSFNGLPYDFAEAQS